MALLLPTVPSNCVGEKLMLLETSALALPEVINPPEQLKSMRLATDPDKRRRPSM